MEGSLAAKLARQLYWKTAKLKGRDRLGSWLCVGFGDNPSQVYVRNVENVQLSQRLPKWSCTCSGDHYQEVNLKAGWLPNTTTSSMVWCLVQLPLPNTRWRSCPLAIILCAQDVDGFHPLNMSLAGHSVMIPNSRTWRCFMSMIDLEGKMQSLLSTNIVMSHGPVVIKNATVTLTHCAPTQSSPSSF